MQLQCTDKRLFLALIKYEFHSPEAQSAWMVCTTQQVRFLVTPFHENTKGGEVLSVLNFMDNFFQIDELFLKIAKALIICVVGCKHSF